MTPFNVTSSSTNGKITRTTASNRNEGQPNRVEPNDDSDEPQVHEIEHSLPAVVRERQRAVAEREAARLARPDASKSLYRLSHADRSKSAVSSTPSGVLAVASENLGEQTNEEWCGPWAVARQMIAKREEARQRREDAENDENGNSENHPLDDVMLQVLLEQKQQQHPSMQWRSSVLSKHECNDRNESLYSKRQKRMDVSQKGRKIPSLFDLCVLYLSKNVDQIESLGIDTDCHIRTAIMDQLIAKQLLNDEAFLVLAEVGIEALVVSDGSNISEECLSNHIQMLIRSGLKYLSLDQCGRCLSKKAVKALTSLPSSIDCQLLGLSIGGAYSLMDVDAAALVNHFSPTQLSFKACNLLGNSICQSISETYISPLNSLIELVLEDVPLSHDNFQVLTSKCGTWKHLKKLCLRRIDGLDDSNFHNLIGMCSKTLQYLDLTENVSLTDAILSSMRQHQLPFTLHTLILQGLKQLTAMGLEAFFTLTPSDIDAIPKQTTLLQHLNLGQCSHDAVTDDIICLVTGCNRPNSVDDHDYLTSDNEISHHVSTKFTKLNDFGLKSLNLQGSTKLTDASLEYIASNRGSTIKTLTELNVSFCPNITDQGLGYLIDQCHSQLQKIHVWGNAQLTDNLYDGHKRVNDPSFEIVGVWMKKSSSRTIR